MTLHMARILCVSTRIFIRFTRVFSDTESSGETNTTDHYNSRYNHDVRLLYPKL